MINENHLEVFRIAINDFDGMNRSDEDHESDFQKLQDIYNFVDKFIKHTDVRDWEVVSSLKMICSDTECRSENVTVDASARWDKQSQDWQVEKVSEQPHDGFCYDCDGSTQVQEISNE